MDYQRRNETIPQRKLSEQASQLAKFVANSRSSSHCAQWLHTAEEQRLVDFGREFAPI